jgi:hypothetical protein
MCRTTQWQLHCCTCLSPNCPPPEVWADLHNAVLPPGHQQSPVRSPTAAVGNVLEAAKGALYLAAQAVINNHLYIRSTACITPHTKYNRAVSTVKKAVAVAAQAVVSAGPAAAAAAAVAAAKATAAVEAAE